MRLFKKKKNITGDHTLTLKQANFLLNLQKELREETTENSFYTILVPERIYGVEATEADGTSLRIDKKTLAEDLKQIARFITEDIVPKIAETKGILYSIRYDEEKDMIEAISQDSAAGIPRIEELANAADLNRWFEKNGYDAGRAAYYKKIMIMSDSAVFLTKKAANKYLENNREKYGSEAVINPCITWRCSQYEELVNVLKEADLDVFMEIAAHYGKSEKPDSLQIYVDEAGRKYVYDERNGLKRYLED